MQVVTLRTNARISGLRFDRSRASVSGSASSANGSRDITLLNGMNARESLFEEKQPKEAAQNDVTSIRTTSSHSTMFAYETLCITVAEH